MPFTEADMIRLYDIESRKVHSSLDHMLKIRGMVAIAFATLLSATLYYQKGLLALGGVVFLGAWYWEYVYARYMEVDVFRAGRLAEWIVGKVENVPRVAEAYSSGYDHRLTYRMLRGLGQKEKLRSALATFFDIPRMALYLTISLAPIFVAAALRFPWIEP